MPPLPLTGRDLTIDNVVEVARGRRSVALDPAAADRMRASRTVVERIVADGTTAYGITTGFGDLADVRIEPARTAELQRNLVRSHAAGVGEPLHDEIVRSILLLRANALAVGLSGVRVEVVELLLAMLNMAVHPVVPSRGSLGASGDLAPLAHVALVLIGEGEASVDGAGPGSGADAMARAGLAPLTLEAKEGLALLNGTQLMQAVGALAHHDALRLAISADVIGAMSLEAMLGTGAAFDERLIAARAHPGQVASARHLRELLRDSEIWASHRADTEHRVQDAYSLRCMPQVHGAARDVLAELERVLAVEMNAATDNPLIFPTGEVVSGGNFHGEPLALALDYATLAVAELASISERRTARLVDAHLNGGLPAFLAEDPGLESGLMIAHYTAAALVNELQGLAHPASVDTIPTSANQEDHVSMGGTAALKLRTAVDRTEHVLAIEALAAAQGLDFRAPMRPGTGVAAAHATLRDRVAHRRTDAPPAPEIDAVRRLLHEGGLLANAATGRAHDRHADD
jgi:histidine ammonia-lyase